MILVRTAICGCLICLGVVVAVGCNKTVPSAAPTVAPESQTAGQEHEHGEWWCGEHGVPEAICAQCKVELVADFKAKNDWCKEHDRPDSQCFICHPEKEAEFAAQYEAKYGKQPPTRKAAEADHDHAKT